MSLSVRVHILFDKQESTVKAMSEDSLIGSLLDEYSGFEFTCGHLLNYEDTWHSFGETQIIVSATACDDVVIVKIITNNKTTSITTKMSSKRPLGAAFALFEQVAYQQNKRSQQWSYCYENKPIRGDDSLQELLIQELLWGDEISIVAFSALVSCYPGITFSNTCDKEMLLFDKSLFIEHVLEKRKSQHSLILRPRRFGKSFNLNMLSYFLDINQTATSEKLFKDLKIMQREDLCKLHMNKYPVVLISFNGVVSNSLEETRCNILHLLTKLVNEFGYLLNSETLTDSDKQKLLEYQKQTDTFALEHLIECLHKHHQSKVVLLIDEYDSPLMGSVYMSFRKEIFEIFANIFSFLKRNESIEFSLFMGIVLLTDMGYLSGLNNLCYYSTQSDEIFTTEFGITQPELSSALKRIRGKDYPGLDTEFKELNHWYNGYNVDGNSKLVFNMWSLCSYFALGKISDYWISTGTTGELVQILNIESSDDIEMIDDLETLKNGGEIEIDMSLDVDVTIFTCGQIKRKHELFWKLMFYSGYLTGSKTSQTSNVRESCSQITYTLKNPFFLRCPNEEVRSNIQNSFIAKIGTCNRSWNESKTDVPSTPAWMR
ncbi:predicted protein [Naegleria gruberi]|uniref:Predicted protein n=1 Tax=Naegleria gruberi TaxID=5762 RepID=D2VEH6_NAEGR|nr:uncharacterized protein NAEGRDRAFT_48898 [Naegleria gruberi]EFC44880.1 predicted protein [Naegleria gruberi]|eukprot:XP_002677624.1 predicted protein [Naegleria gruberi strain NEG-M]